jgi:hypothetical protein
MALFSKILLQLQSSVQFGTCLCVLVLTLPRKIYGNSDNEMYLGMDHGELETRKNYTIAIIAYDCPIFFLIMYLNVALLSCSFLHLHFTLPAKKK